VAYVYSTSDGVPVGAAAEVLALVTVSVAVFEAAL
jgi:hypothetical protein